MITISQPSLGPDVEDEVLAVLRSGHLAQGTKVAELERTFTQLTGCSNAIAVTSGTVALELALSTLGLRPGDEVITSPFTFGATLNAIIHSGANARFVDVDEHGLIDPALIPQILNPATRVVVPVHLYGLPVDMGELRLPESVAVVEDAAQAVGAEVGNRHVGSFGIGCFSLYATKNITTGEGGILTTDDDALARRLRLIRNQGMESRYEYLLPGHNFRMTDLQAAVGLPQMRRLQEITQRRTSNAGLLSNGLMGISGLVLPFAPTGRTHVWHQFTVRVTTESRISRDALADQLRRHGIATGIHYPRLVYDYECYRENPQVRADPTPNAREFCSQVLSLPVHPGLSETDIDHIVSEVRNALGA